MHYLYKSSLNYGIGKLQLNTHAMKILEGKDNRGFAALGESHEPLGESPEPLGESPEPLGEIHEFVNFLMMAFD